MSRCVLNKSMCRIDCTLWPEGWDKSGCPNFWVPKKPKKKKIRERPDKDERDE